MDDTTELKSHLTEQELQISRSAEIDIGAGYPHLVLPPWMANIVQDRSAFGLAYGFWPDVTADKINDANRALLLSACRLLGIADSHAQNGFATFSGSIALDRAIESQLGHGRTVVSTTPAIDIIPGMISERSEVRAIYVPATAGFDIDLDGVASAIDDKTDCIILTSPENPTGNVLTVEQLSRVAELARDRGITLIVDQCFALIDPFGHGVPLLPDIVPDGLSWIFIWDTGKTFGLNEEKLGFLFCSPDLTESLSNRLNVLQFDVSRRLKVMFRRLFDAARTENYRLWLSERVRLNVETVEAACADLPLRPRRPDAGSFLLLDTTATGLGGVEFSGRLLDKQRLGVIRASSFYVSGPSGALAPDHDSFIRLAMAREDRVILEAMRRLTAACASLV